MVAIKVQFVLTLFVGTALASPLANPLEVRDRTLTCTVDGNKVSFSEDYGKWLRSNMPAGNVTTASGYPHVFANQEEIKWDDVACNSPRVTTLEFPVLEGQKPPDHYQWNQKPKPDPGPCRVVYGQVGGHYCGVMCHKTRSNNGDDDRGFVKCE